jgi:uncharacterized protein YjbJ (UPF0337 family)
MNEDTIEGKARDFVGEAKETVGRMTGDRETEVEGKFDQARGKIQENYGAVRDGAAEVIDNAIDTVREYPVSSILIAAAVGWLIGRR